MGKISDYDKMRIQTLRELGFGYRKLRAKFPDKNWKIGTVKSICRRVDERGSAVKRKSVLGNQFILQQYGAPAHGAKLAQDWLTSHCPDFIDKDSWPSNSPDLIPRLCCLRCNA